MSATSTSVYDGRAATDRASCVISAGNVARRRSATDNVQTDSLVDPRSRRPGVPRVDRRGPTSPSDRSPRNSPRRRRRRPLARRLWPMMTVWCCRVAEAAAAGRAGCRRMSTSRAGSRPPTSCRGTHDDSERRRQLAGSTWRRRRLSPPPARSGLFLSSTCIDYQPHSTVVKRYNTLTMKRARETDVIRSYSYPRLRIGALNCS